MPREGLNNYILKEFITGILEKACYENPEYKKITDKSNITFFPEELSGILEYPDGTIRIFSLNSSREGLLDEIKKDLDRLYKAQIGYISSEESSVLKPASLSVTLEGLQQKHNELKHTFDGYIHLVNTVWGVIKVISPLLFAGLWWLGGFLIYHLELKMDLKATERENNHLQQFEHRLTRLEDQAQIKALTDKVEFLQKQIKTNNR
jgi:hypothetical protein